MPSRKMQRDISSVVDLSLRFIGHIITIPRAEDKICQVGMADLGHSIHAGA